MEIKYPQAAIDAGVKGTIQVSFIIDVDGLPKDFKILQDIGHGTGQAVIDVIKRRKKWLPGITSGQPVPVKYELPVRMDLSQG